MGYKRAHGQQSHDRLALQYRPTLEKILASSWNHFIHELQSDAYKSFWREMLSLSPRTPIILTMHWHYAPPGASVSPHTDARRKIGSHIFYFNTPEDWDEAWGGQTLVLDDGGKWPRHSAPDYADLREAGASQVLVSLRPDRSLLVCRQGCSVSTGSFAQGFYRGGQPPHPAGDLAAHPG